MTAKITAFIVALISFFSNLFGSINVFDNYEFTVSSAVLGETVKNMVSNVNVWDMGTEYADIQKNEQYDITEFTEYIQFMQCSGGSFERDLFVNPYDKTVLDDYDFTRLIKNCEGVLSLGCKPMLKLGNVPVKYSSNAKKGTMSDNICPPDDYEQYYRYIEALAAALVNSFGKDEVMSWHFGVLTEFENSNWFMAENNSPVTTKEAYFKLYDYTVAALQNVIGQNVYVGAHAMGVTEGLWDETEFIRHCAVGKNYYTGKHGTRLCYINCSYYDVKPGEFTSGKTVGQMFSELKEAALIYGLNNLDYGIDEGRILYSNTSGKDSDELLSRTVGYTWQAAYDARMFGQLMDSGVDYFSAWSYLSGGLWQGIPNITYHTAKQIYSFAGSKRASVEVNKAGKLKDAEINVYAGYNQSTETLHAFVYNFKNDLNYKRSADVKLNFNIPQLNSGEVKVQIYRINDDCNFFDEWCKDRKTYGITDDMFSWSPDDGNIIFLNSNGKELFYNELAEKYAGCATLTPETITAKIVDGEFTITAKAEANTVIFFTVNK